MVSPATLGLGRKLRLLSASIMLLLLLNQLPALSALSPYQANDDSKSTGRLSVQTIEFRGDGGQAFYIPTSSTLKVNSLYLSAVMYMEGSSATGIGQINFEGTTQEGSHANIKIEYKITGVQNLAICNNLPSNPQCSQEIVPLAYSGRGLALIQIGEYVSYGNIGIVLDVLNSSTKSNPIYVLTVLDPDYQPILKFSTHSSE